MLRHYVEVGVTFAVSPTSLFDLPFYRGQVGSIDGDPLRHYLIPDGFSRYSPHPAIDIYYYSRRAGFSLTDIPSVLHLLSTPQGQRISPHPAFDALRYERAYKDIGKAGACPILHFIEHGMEEDRSPNEWFSAEYVYRQYPLHDFRHESAVHFYFAGDMGKRARLVFVSHDASLTGAPGTALRLTEDLAGYSNVECFAVVAKRGPRVRDFQRTAHTIVLNTPFYLAPQDLLRGTIRHLLELTEGNIPVAAVVNSAESRAIAPELARAGIPVLTLVHEAADLYPQGAFDGIVESSEAIIFGSQYVLDRANSVLAIPHGLAQVRGQGLQQDYVGTMNRDTARRLVMNELELDPDVFLVLGCGSVDYRKGADLFVSAALDFLRRDQGSAPRACFIWVGQSDGSILQSFINNSIRSEGRDIDIRFIGPRGDVEPYFVSADAFLMTSRVDPFPCVCQEAMASGLPIVAFTEGGGTIEMIGEDAGFCVPLGDTVTMGARLHQLAADPGLRRRLGHRGREIVRQRWRPSDYASFIAGQLSDISSIGAERFGTPPSRSSMVARALFLLDNWEASPFQTHIGEIVEGLRATGVDAEILLTRGRFTPESEGAHVPAAQHRFLSPGAAGHSDGRWRTSAEEVWRELRQFSRSEQPCIFFTPDDALATALAPLLPSSVAIVPLLTDSDSTTIEAHYWSGPRVDAIVAITEAAARALTSENPTLASKISLIEPGAEVISTAGDALRRLILIHADLAQRATRTAVLDLSHRLRERGLSYRLVVSSVRMEAKQSRRSVATSLGISVDDLLIGQSYEAEGLLGEAEFVLLMESDSSALVLLPKAVAARAIVIAVSPSVELLHALAGSAGIPVRSGAKAITDLIARLSARPEELAGYRSRADSWLRRQDGTLETEVAKYRELVERLMNELRSTGSRRPLDLPHLAGQKFVWSTSMHRIALSEIMLPPSDQ